jgi:hypothetical protein
MPRENGDKLAWLCSPCGWKGSRHDCDTPIRKLLLSDLKAQDGAFTFRAAFSFAVSWISATSTRSKGNLSFTMKVFATLSAIAALLPAVFACKGYTGGVPKAVGTKTNKAVIEVAAGQVFDGQWYRYDRGSGACNSQAEGGKETISRLLDFSYLTAL